jgi:hypothetical protein
VWNTITSKPSASSVSRTRRTHFSVVPSVPINTSGFSWFTAGS